MDAMNFSEPLEEVGLELIEELRKQGKADKCGSCGKPFNHARKWRLIKRLLVYLPGHGVFSWTALLCGKCEFDFRHDNREAIDRINREAFREADLLKATPEGRA